MSFRVLVLGGYGTFGSRIARRLVQTPPSCPPSKVTSLVVAGRDAAKAQAFAASLPGEVATGIGLDCSDDAALRAACAQADCVVHTVGPFQYSAGADPFSVPRAAIESGASYVDISDARRWVCDFRDALDALARAHGVCAVSGASSVPGLSSAAVDLIRPATIDTIDIGINPGNQTPRGLATVRAILSYCGKDIACTRDGRAATVVGWLGAHWRAYPGAIGRRLLSHCDVPDIELFPRHYGARSVLFSAGLELAPLHLATCLLAVPVRLGLVADVAAYARPLAWLSERLKPLGSTRGALHVEVAGAGADGAEERRTFFLCADNGVGNPTLENTPGAIAGPEIPVTPAVVLVHKLAEAAARREPLPLASGAYPCISLFTIDEAMASMEGMKVWTEAH